ncbi:uncharacterized protein EV422DRAFT_618666 [Fimicolochytrium jonesii]|uniref:uncharacterized protein n=1 Tax=Fimicolochytrium jonesii TaxID=1396493 RepID=UPI0022FE9A95|nr:uncharacterized protein EV422DRAFT_618666 [Fimicolochytrium jonesii]KAI8822946.1 hypothetical protein EV422DRAFT_618666 [Fimicolochytrium jonesii]
MAAETESAATALAFVASTDGATGHRTYAPHLSRPKVMLLFVHGFLGSEHSFENFPLDLTQSVRTKHHVWDMEARIFPRFDTKGDPTRAVNQLCNWLLLNATQPEYSGVVILAHSMGGLMVVDAFRKMYGLGDPEPPSDKTLKTGERKDKGVPSKAAPSSWFRAAGSWWAKKHPKDTNKVDLKTATEQVEIEQTSPTRPATAAGPVPNEGIVGDALAEAPSLPAQTPGISKRPPVNIIGLIAFDAPFFGLQSRVYTTAAGTRAAKVISDYVPPLPPMPAIPTPGLPFSNALQSIPQVVGAGVQASTNVVGALPHAASEALRYSTRAVGSIPEAAQGVVGALPGAASQGFHMGFNAVTALPGATASLGSMGYTAVTSLPGATVSLGSTALQSVALLPSMLTSRMRGASPKPDEAASTNTTDAAAPTSADPMNVVADVDSLPVVVPEAVQMEEVSAVPDNAQSPATLAPEMMQDEAVIFAAAVAAANAEVNHSQETIARDSSNEATDAVDPSTVGSELAPLIPFPNDPTDTPSDAAASAMGLHPIPKESNWAPWVRLGLAGAAMAAGAYYSGGLIYAGPVVRRVAVAYALSHAEEARQHLQFLYPLWGTGTKQLNDRLGDVMAEMEAGRLRFKCFYVMLPPAPLKITAPPDTTAEKADGSKGDDVQNFGKREPETTTEGTAGSQTASQLPDSVFTDAKAHVSSASKDRLKARLATVVGASPIPTPSPTTESEKQAETAPATPSNWDALSSLTTPSILKPAEPPTIVHPQPLRSPVAAAFAAKLAASRQSPAGSAASSLAASPSISPSGTPPAPPPRPPAAVEDSLNDDDVFESSSTDRIRRAKSAPLLTRHPTDPTPEPGTSSSTTNPSQDPPTTQTPTGKKFAEYLKSARPSPGSHPAPPPRTFIALPPQDFAHMFLSVHSDCGDEIAAHMNMFAREENASSYWGLVDAVAKEVVEAVRTVESLPRRE